MQCKHLASHENSLHSLHKKGRQYFLSSFRQGTISFLPSHFLPSLLTLEWNFLSSSVHCISDSRPQSRLTNPNFSSFFFFLRPKGATNHFSAALAKASQTQESFFFCATSRSFNITPFSSETKAFSPDESGGRPERARLKSSLLSWFLVEPEKERRKEGPGA